MPRGIILTNGTPTNGMMFHMALVWDQNYRYARDFKLMPVQKLIKRMRREREVDEQGKKRTYFVPQEDDLIYGHTIEWEEFDSRGEIVELVREYKKIPEVYPSRIFDGETQLLLHGIMSKNRKVLWMCDIWPDLEIPLRLQQDSHPDVTINAWVTLHIRENQTLKYELHSIHSVADTFQTLVRKAAWNEGDDGNLQMLYDPVAGDVQNPDYINPLSDTITQMQGTVISKKIVLAADPKHRDYCFHRVVLREGDRFPQIGAPVRFNAEKLDFLNIYAITDIVELTGMQQLPTADNGMIKLTIRHQPDLPGFYFTEMLQCYVDDPDNVLEVWLLTPYIKSTLQVTITATEPSCKGTPRFAIVGITDAKLKKIEKFRADGLAKITREFGIVYDLKGRIHVPRLPKSMFRIPASEVAKYPPGTRLFINARLGPKKWIIDSIDIDLDRLCERAAIVMDRKTRREQIWLNVPRARGCNPLPFLVSTPVFGLIQTPKAYRIRRRPENYTFDDIWVTLNDSHPGEAMFKPPAKFKFIALGNIERYGRACDQVILPPPRSLTSEDYPELDLDLDLTLQNELELNDCDVPIPLPETSPEDYDRHHKNYKMSVKEMIRELERDPKWKSHPNQLIDKQIDRHLNECSMCSKHEFSDRCYFAEYLSEVLHLNPDVNQILKSDTLTMLTTRRYKK